MFGKLICFWVRLRGGRHKYHYAGKPTSACVRCGRLKRFRTKKES